MLLILKNKVRMYQNDNKSILAERHTDSVLKGNFPNIWFHGTYDFQNSPCTWKELGVYSLLYPFRTLSTFGDLYSLYIDVECRVQKSLLVTDSLRVRSSLEYMCFFAILQYNVIEHDCLFTKISETHEKIIQETIIVYTKVMEIDDKIDLHTNIDEMYIERLFSIFWNELGTIPRDSNNIHISTIFMYYMQSSNRWLLQDTIERCKNAFLLECRQKNQIDIWNCLRIQALSLAEFMSYIPRKYSERQYTSSMNYVFGQILFMGNIADDWMDYCWTKEDRDTSCYINIAKQNLPIWLKSWGKGTIIIVMLQMLYMLCLELGNTQKQVRKDNRFRSLFPSLAILSLYTGIRNIYKLFVHNVTSHMNGHIIT